MESQWADEIRVPGKGGTAMMTAFVRTVILYLLLMAGLRLMGKRQIGELEPGELVLTMMISDLATVPMQDFGIPLLSGIIPIVTLLSLSLLLSQLSLHSVRIRELLCGVPVTLIENGVLCQRAMTENRYTLDELMEELRQQGYAGIEEVRYAVLENSGKLSVLPRASSRPPTAEELGLDIEDSASLPVVLVNDGRVLDRNLSAAGRDRAWLMDTLHARGLSGPEEAFLLTADGQGRVVCVRKEGTP